MFDFSRIRWLTSILALLIFFILLGILGGVAATNTIRTGGLSHTSHPLTANQLKPAECNGIDLKNIVDLSQGDSATQGNDLILGTTGNDTINGKKGNDCIIGGGGNDEISGNRGDDVILGGDGDDIIVGGRDNDTCYGNDGNDTLTCDTEYP